MSDIHTKSGLTDLYNKNVVKVERMERPMGSSGSANVPFVNHQGVRYCIAVIACKHGDGKG